MVEGAALEMLFTRKGNEGSNPSLSVESYMGTLTTSSCLKNRYLKPLKHPLRFSISLNYSRCPKSINLKTQIPMVQYSEQCGLVLNQLLQ